jgi:hypothetical protein
MYLLALYDAIRRCRTSHTPVGTCLNFAETQLATPEILEPIRRQRGVARGVLDIAVPQVGLQRSGVVAVIRELVPTAMAEHVGVSLDA